MTILLRRLCALAIIIAPVTSHGQIQDVGSDAALDVATWNIEWFGSTSNGPSNVDLQVQNVADIILGSGIDIWAVQELANLGRVQELMDKLPDNWDDLLATDTGQQRIGFFWNTQVLQLRTATHFLQSFDYEFAGRPPLKAEFNVTLPDTSFEATFMVVHMKAFGDRRSWERRTEAARRIKNHIDFTSLATQPVFFLGDYNDELSASTYNGERSPYAPFLEDPDDYDVLTWPLEQAGGFSFQSGSFLDHIIVSNEAADMWVNGSTRVLSNLVTFNSFYARTSDHLPVVASFGPSTITDVEEASELPAMAGLSAPWPNPALHQTSVRYEGLDPSARIQILDVLGRVVSEQAARYGENVIDLSRQGAGLYMIRVLTSSATPASRMVLKLDR
jgi:endonuclease/exonuclease/phosphatase family metal-dependent hydrolase